MKVFILKSSSRVDQLLFSWVLHLPTPKEVAKVISEVKLFPPNLLHFPAPSQHHFPCPRQHHDEHITKPFTCLPYSITSYHTLITVRHMHLFLPTFFYKSFLFTCTSFLHSSEQPSQGTSRRIIITLKKNHIWNYNITPASDAILKQTIIHSHEQISCRKYVARNTFRRA